MKIFKPLLSLFALSAVCGLSQAPNVQANPVAPLVTHIKPTPENEVLGSWMGTIPSPSDPSDSLRVLIDLQKVTDGSIAGSIVSLDNSSTPVRITRTFISGKSVRIEVKSINAVFDGTETSDNEIRGEWKRNGVSAPLNIRRATSWLGTLNVPDRSLHIVFTIPKASEVGYFTGSMKFPGQNSQEIAVNGLRSKENDLYLVMSQTGAKFEGKISKDGQQVSGIYAQQNGGTFPLLLDLKGNDWEGTMPVPGTKLRFLFRVAPAETGYMGSLLSVDRTTAELPLSSVIMTDKSASFMLPGGGGFTGTFKDPDTLVGDWDQQGKEPLELKRLK